MNYCNFRKTISGFTMIAAVLGLMAGNSNAEPPALTRRYSGPVVAHQLTANSLHVDNGQLFCGAGVACISNAFETRNFNIRSINDIVGLQTFIYSLADGAKSKDSAAEKDCVTSAFVPNPSSILVGVECRPYNGTLSPAQLQEWVQNHRLELTIITKPRPTSTLP